MGNPNQMPPAAASMSRAWSRWWRSLIAVSAVLMLMAAGYFAYDLIAARVSPCEAIFRQTSVNLSTRIRFLKTEGEIQVGRAPLAELDERAQMTALNLKTCCTVLDAGRLDPEQFLQCKDKARAYTARVEDIVALVQAAMKSETATMAAAASSATAGPSQPPVDARISEQVAAARTISQSFNREVVETRRAQQLESLKALPPQHVAVAAQEQEPNNDLLSTNLIELDTWVSASIGDPKDSDYYTFTTPPKYRDWIRIELENRSTTLEPRIELFDAEKTSLGTQHKTTRGADLAYAFAAKPDTRYVFRVSNYYGETVGAYLVRVRAMKAYDAYESNDDILSARAVEIGSPITAAIMDKSDVDFFRFVTEPANAEREVTIEIRNTSTTLRPGIVVYDESKSNIGSRQNTTGGGDLRYSFKARPDAPYYVRVADYYGDAAGAYVLTITAR